ncbi:asparagine synthetase B family protein [Bailinhaonella thermotolerans]|uniref:Asparagine synthetase B family protein n=1 Tax=Bailinhaonella thermotolerans TaxID=1070861 RepID=A0A3A4A6F2_9ACTN|nr:asparagine synthetase B family protein [Bailinhaonella thermotolerans]RJL24486.1 asparagine synthetase B family protein [Bailinhaonella thermotolerans]
MVDADWPEYAARPYFCGALGEIAPDKLSLLRESGPSVELVVSEPHVALYGSRALTPYAPGAYTFGFTAPPAGDAPWLTIAETYETPGLVAGRDSATLHAGGFGLVDVFYVTLGGAVYFANLIEPLLALLPRPLRINWDAWAAILRLTYPLGTDTPYQDVRRLPGSAALVWSGGRLRMDARMPRWVRAEPYARGATAGDVIAALHEAFKPYDDVPLLVPVSGGYDSRLLASIAVARGASVESWTTSPDDGLDTDVEYAQAITRELGIRHRVIEQDPAAYPAEALRVARRLEYVTSHHAWYARFAAEVHGSNRSVVDGLAGGPLLKNFLISSTTVAATTAADRRRGMLEALSLGPAHLPVLSPAADSWTSSSVEAAFTAATSMLHGHRAELPLSVLHTRTARGIARSPVNLVGPERAPVFPFLDPGFFDLALSVPVAQKDGGRFYRELLRAANPRVASLPSTNAAMPNRRVPLRSAGPAARAWSHRMASRAAAVPGLLSLEMREALTSGPDALTAFASWNSRFWLRGLAVFGAWLTDYENDLEDPVVPWS